MMKKIIVSVIVPCYNQEVYIQECLDSVQKQTYVDFECIIVNDGSVDGSIHKIKPFLEDKRFQLIDKENEGLAMARNTGISYSKGKYILPLDGDDKIHEKYVEKAVRVHEKNKNISLVYCNAKYFGDVNIEWELPKYSYDLMLVSNCVFCTAMYKKEAFMLTEGYDPKLVYGYEDWELWLQLLNEKSQVYQINEVLFFYRQRENSMSSFVKNKKKHDITLDYVYKKHFSKYINYFFDCNFMNDTDIFVKLLENTRIKNDYERKIKNIKKTISYKVFYKIEHLLRFIKK